MFSLSATEENEDFLNFSFAFGNQSEMLQL